MKAKNFKELDDGIAAAFLELAKALPMEKTLQLDKLRDQIITDAKSIGKQCYIDGSNDCHKSAGQTINN